MASEHSVSERLQPWTVIEGLYRLTRRIARGRTSDVWLASDVQSEQTVVLGFLLEELDELRLRRLIAEVDSLAAIQNPHVAAVYRCGFAPEAGGIPYIAMEWLPGTDLAEELARCGRLDTRDAIRLGVQLCEGLAAFHEQKIHRSIRPSTIFFVGEGPARTVKLIDGGIAGLLELGSSRVGRDRAASDGLQYLSPEQLTDGRDLDERSDVWSVGMVLYEALSGQLPFPHQAAPAEIIAITLAGHFSLTEIPPALKPVVDRCLRGRDERFPSAWELADALRRADGSMPSTTGRSRPSKGSAAPPAPEPAPQEARPARDAKPQEARPAGDARGAKRAQPNDARRTWTWLLATAGAIVTVGALIGVLPVQAMVPFRPMSVTLLLGIVEGLTEYLPVSSTGHLALVGHILGLPDDAATSSFEIVIQLGAILAVVVQYRALLASHARGLLRREPASIRLLLALAISFAPAAFVGLLFRKAIKAYLFKPLPIAAALIVGGIAMIAVERIRARKGIKGLEGLQHVTPGRALTIGLGQCLSLWPGSSRSMSTIIAAQLSGLSTATAAEFSFLLALPTLGAATVFEGYKARHLLLEGGGAVHLVVGLVVSFLVAWAVIASFLRYLRARGLEPFGWYRIVIGVIAIWVLAS